MEPNLVADAGHAARSIYGPLPCLVEKANCRAEYTQSRRSRRERRNRTCNEYLLESAAKVKTGNSQSKLRYLQSRQLSKGLWCKMSSLSRQLSALRRSTGSDGRSGRASFLFTHEDAQRVDTETIYNIALTGLMQLTKTDSRFVQFEGKLFGASARSLRRDHETTDVNSQIDQDIAAYLRLLSAYLLQRPAQQTLEFLVRAYQVHRLNVDAVVECFIPYHQTKPFIRMVKILQIQGTKWQFLAAVRQTGTYVFHNPTQLY